MRILIITVYYHPVMTPNVFRWSAIAEEWVGRGHEVHVLCSERSPLPGAETIEGVRIHRAGHGSLLDWANNRLKTGNRNCSSFSGTLNAFTQYPLPVRPRKLPNRHMRGSAV